MENLAPFKKSDNVGKYNIFTSDVVAQNCYITLAILDGRIFDAIVSPTIEQAEKSHAEFIYASQMMGMVEERLGGSGAITVNMPTSREIH